MSKIIFYSWQSDLPNNTNRSFIQDALRWVIKELNKSSAFKDSIIEESDRKEDHTESSLRPMPAQPIARLDQATAGTSGAVHIAQTILGKILKSDVVVADVSTINKGTRKYRKMPNPNVAFELGYAWATQGPDRLILVLNRDVTNDIADIPFDVRGHKFIAYDLPEDCNAEVKKAEKDKLKNHLYTEILAILSADAPRPYELNGLSDVEVRRRKDRDTLVKVFRNISLDVIDEHIHIFPGHYSYAMALVYDEFFALYRSIDFHIHNKELRKLLDKFATSWRSVMPGKYESYFRETNDPCTERYLNHHEADLIHALKEAELGRELLKQAVAPFHNAMNELLAYTHEKFPDIDPRALGNGLDASVKQRLREIRKGS